MSRNRFETFQRLMRRAWREPEPRAAQHPTDARRRPFYVLAPDLQWSHLKVMRDSVRQATGGFADQACLGSLTSGYLSYLGFSRQGLEKGKVFSKQEPGFLCLCRTGRWLIWAPRRHALGPAPPDCVFTSFPAVSMLFSLPGFPSMLLAVLAYKLAVSQRQRLASLLRQVFTH